VGVVCVILYWSIKLQTQHGF